MLLACFESHVRSEAAASGRDGTDAGGAERAVVGDNVPRMTGKDFRRIVLGLKGAIEGAHMGHPDFRVNARIFATLRNRDTLGMVVLTPEQQRTFVRDYPEAFGLESGAWGRAGCTQVRLESVDEEILGEAATLAWRHAVSKPAAKVKKAAKTVRLRRTRGSRSSER